LLWPQEVTMSFFVCGVFIGAAAATRRNDHLCLSRPARVDTRFARRLKLHPQIVRSRFRKILTAVETQSTTEVQGDENTLEN
jgi:hypothetical protein